MKKKYFIIISVVITAIYIALIIWNIKSRYDLNKNGRYTIAYIADIRYSNKGADYEFIYSFNNINYDGYINCGKLYQHTKGDSVYIKVTENSYGDIDVIDNVMQICIPGDTIPINGWKEIPICR